MDCQTAKNNMHLYIDNMLSGTDRERFIHHIENCEQCRNALEDFMAVKNAMSSMNMAEPPKGLALEAIKKAKKRRIPVFAYASACIAAAAVLVVFLSTDILSGGGMDMTSDSAAEEPMVFSVTNQAESKDAPAGAAMMKESIEMDMAMPEDEDALMSQDTQLVEETAAAQERESSDAAEEAGPCICMFEVSGDRASDFMETLDAFIDTHDIEADYTESTEGTHISFVIEERFFSDFIEFVDGLDHSGYVEPRCIAEFTFS